MSFDQTVIIIPTYNEALNVHSMIERLFALYPDISVLIIDDNSPDKTAFVVEALRSKYPQLYLIKREGKLGLGTAYIEGFKWALLKKKFNYIAQMDCDFSHDPTDVARLLQALKDEKAQLAIGSRYSDQDVRTKEWPWYRLMFSMSASFILRLFTGLLIKDIAGGFKCFHRDALSSMNFDNMISKGFIFQFEMNYKIHSAGFKIVEVPIIFYQRLLGQSKMNLNIAFEAIIVLLKLRYRKFLNRLN